MQHSASGTRASSQTLSRREREAERARERYAKTHSHKAQVAMTNATTKALRASPFGSGRPAAKPSDAERTSA